MNIPTREQLETRMHALVADHLDQIAEQCPEGFDLGVIAFVVEVIYPYPEFVEIRREEGGYWPPSDAATYQSYLCTDWRPRVKADEESKVSRSTDEMERLIAEMDRLIDAIDDALGRVLAEGRHPPEDGEVED
jgi:hypothetical protein